MEKFVAEKKETWEDYLDTCIYAYNTSRHESSLFTPFELKFGRKAVVPIDLCSGSKGTDEIVENDVNEEEIAMMQDARRKRLEEAN